ncbi:hypothetical protein AB205_0040750 [Aquarana catesbeiana]|uniref:Uncharacterized protein n=1 Tax=Aquarana catesbeiana TaxID=8400 RepID=A0A2G9RMU5_AQUCT|nr:hypothetical protein AB205_0040750 [Aquarana catesbeiana]
MGLDFGCCYKSILSNCARMGHDVIYTGITAIFYLSAAVLQAYATILCDYTIAVALPNIFGINQCFRVLYHLDAAATFFAFLTSLIYMLHSFQSYVR